MTIDRRCRMAERSLVDPSARDWSTPGSAISGSTLVALFHGNPSLERKEKGWGPGAYSGPFIGEV